MSVNLSSASFEFAQPSGNLQTTKPSSETPMQICVLGNFSGGIGSATLGHLNQRRPIQIGCDNFDSVLKRVQPSLELCFDDIDSNKVKLQFTSLEDFHPDKLLNQKGITTLLKNLKQDISESKNPHSVATKVQDQQRAESESDDETITRLLGTPKRESTEKEAINNMLKKIVALHIVPKADPQQKELATEIDDATATLLRKILHNPAFQELEAAWRNLDFLVRQLDTCGDINFYLFDVSNKELLEDLKSVQSQEQTTLFRILVEKPQSHTPDPWAIVVGLYNFACIPSDLSLLKYFSNICAAVQTPFLTSAEYGSFDAVAECDVSSAIEGDPVKQWNDFRKSPAASYLGLCLPRFLLRLPYGQTTDPIEQFNFEEIPKEPVHSNYLWGNPAILCACLLGQSFTENGWNFTPGDNVELDGLPLHVYKHDGESKITPCAEHWLSEGATDNLLKFGLIPFLYVQGKDAIRIARFQSAHSPPAALSGHWN